MSGEKTPIDFSVDKNRELAGRIGFAWRDIRRGTSNTAVRELIFEGDGYAIEPGQYDTLEMIVLHGTVRMGDLAEALRVDPSTATRAVQRLIKDGYVERTEHGDDGRVVHVKATDNGHDIYTRVVDGRRRVLMSIMEKFTPEECEALADMLQRFNVALDQSVEELSRIPR